MPELTEYLKLKKPIKNKEIADIDVINENSDTIDLKFKEQDKNLDGKEPAISKKTGFNLDKTDEVENDSNKLFSAKGALNLKNWLVSNYTTLMNNIKEALDTKIEAAKNSLISLINGKLNHGGYAGSGQDLKNLADSKVSKAGDTMLGNLTIQTTNYPSILLNNTSAKNNDKNQAFLELNQDGFVNIGTRNKDIVGQGQKILSWNSNKEGEIYHTGNKPEPKEIGALDSTIPQWNNKSVNWLNISGVTQIGNGCTDMPENSNIYGQFVTFKNTLCDTITQMYSEYESSKTWIRTGNGYFGDAIGKMQPWKQIITIVSEGIANELNWRVYSDGSVQIFGIVFSRRTITLPITLPSIQDGKFSISSCHAGQDPIRGVTCVYPVTTSTIYVNDGNQVPIQAWINIFSRP